MFTFLYTTMYIRLCEKRTFFSWESVQVWLLKKMCCIWSLSALWDAAFIALYLTVVCTAGFLHCIVLRVETGLHIVLIGLGGGGLPMFLHSNIPKVLCFVSLCTFHTTTTTVLRPFFWDHPGEPVPEENVWTLRCKGRLTEAETPTIRLGATPSGLTSAHLHHPPIFYGPDALPAAQPTASKHGRQLAHLD